MVTHCSVCRKHMYIYICEQGSTNTQMKRFIYVTLWKLVFFLSNLYELAHSLVCRWSSSSSDGLLLFFFKDELPPRLPRNQTHTFTFTQTTISATYETRALILKHPVFAIIIHALVSHVLLSRNSLGHVAAASAAGQVIIDGFVYAFVCRSCRVLSVHHTSVGHTSFSHN